MRLIRHRVRLDRELHEEDSDLQAQAALGRAAALGRLRSRSPWSRLFSITGLLLAVLLFATAVTAYIVDSISHVGAVLNWYDLNVYNDAGLIVRQLPSILYAWSLTPAVKFTYTPFAALIFASGSLISLNVLHWIATVAGLAGIPLTVWLTLGAMGKRGTARLAVAFAVSALALWTEPVTKALSLGQIEPLLLLLVVWDLTRPDRRWWKGAGVGLAAGIKLVPLIFIPYLLIAGKVRQAAVAAGTFAATVAAGFIILPGPSHLYWLTGYFIRPGRTGAVDALVNQSLLGMMARQFAGVNATQPVWLPVAIAVAVIGVTVGALLNRAGRPVPGWTLVGITGVLVSPISWDHHWVWVVPFLAVLGGLAMGAADRLARWSWLAALLFIAAAFGSWPWHYSGSDAFVPGRGLLGWYVQPPEIYQVTHLQGIKLLTWNLYAIAGCVMYLAIVFGALRIWQVSRRRSKPRNAVASKIDVLLARADAVLSSQEHVSGNGEAATTGGAAVPGRAIEHEQPRGSDDPALRERAS